MGRCKKCNHYITQHTNNGCDVCSYCGHYIIHCSCYRFKECNCKIFEK